MLDDFTKEETLNSKKSDCLIFDVYYIFLVL